MTVVTVDERSLAAWIWSGIAVSGEVDRFLDASHYLATTEASVEADHLKVQVGLEEVIAGDDMLDEFLALADAPAEEILRFANRWGCLMVPGEREMSATWVTVEGEQFKPQESLEDWRQLAGHFQAVLDLAAAGAMKERIGDETIERLRSWGDYRAARRSVDLDLTEAGARLIGGLARLHRARTGEWPAEAIEVAAWVVTCWLDAAPARVRLMLNDADETELVLAPSSMVSALVLKLALAAARSPGLATCVECRRTYMPKRRPKTGQDNYCPDCRRAGAPARNAQRRLRQKKGL